MFLTFSLSSLLNFFHRFRLLGLCKLSNSFLCAPSQGPQRQLVLSTGFPDERRSIHHVHKLNQTAKQQFPDWINIYIQYVISQVWEDDFSLQMLYVCRINLVWWDRLTLSLYRTLQCWGCGDSYRYWFVLLQYFRLVHDLNWRRFLCKYQTKETGFGITRVWFVQKIWIYFFRFPSFFIISKPIKRTVGSGNKYTNISLTTFSDNRQVESPVHLNA